MVRKTLLFKTGGKSLAKPIEIFDSPSVFSKVSSDTSFDVLKLLNQKSMYPRQIAEKLNVDEQKVYYHVNQLLKAGLIEVVKEETRHGAVCKYFAPVAQSFGFELPGGEGVEASAKINPKVREFFHEFTRSGVFDGSIVVGAPVPHGPYDTWANDGHLSAQLGIFLGSLCGLENRFVVKTDTETKAEDAYRRNMIVIGGPLANIVCSDLADKMKVKFSYSKTWIIKSESSAYSDKRDAFIAKIRNPWDATKVIIVVAGLKFEGTKAAIIALTQQYEKIFKSYDKNKDFYCIIRGMDKDGDGKVDDFRVLEII